MKQFYLSSIFILFLTAFQWVAGQAAGDYRSVSSGNWSSPSTWEVYNGVNWVAATDYPGQNGNAGLVTIQNPDEVYINTDVVNQIGRVTVESGASLRLADGADADLNWLVFEILGPDGVLRWEGNGDIHLPGTAVILAHTTAFLTVNTGNGKDNCSGSQIIWIGNRKYSTCQGGSGETNFEDIANAILPPVSGGDQLECAQNPVQTLVATAIPPAGSTVRWYNSLTGSNPINGQPSLNAVGTVTYYAESYNSASGEKSLFRTAVTLTIEPGISISVQPADQSLFAGSNAIFSVSASNSDTYQWQVSTDGGVSFADIDSDLNPTATTASLTIADVDEDMEGNLYRVLVSKSTGSCGTLVSNEALLEIFIENVITNRNKTYRVNKD